jgi:hypothetical protein
MMMIIERFKQTFKITVLPMNEELEIVSNADRFTSNFLEKGYLISLLVLLGDTFRRGIMPRTSNYPNKIDLLPDISWNQLVNFLGEARRGKLINW